MTKNSNKLPTTEANAEVVKASYNAGLASGRLEAIEESMDAVAELVFKAEALMARLGEDDHRARENASHTVRALYLAFAAVTGSVIGGAAFGELLEQAKLRLEKTATTTH